MDQNNDNQNNQTQLLQNFVSEEQKNQLFQELGLDSLPQERKDEMTATMIDNVMGRIFNRIAPNLTQTDLQLLDQLMQQPNSDVLVGQYLTSKVPNLNAIATEEVDKFREEMKASVEAIRASLPQ